MQSPTEQAVPDRSRRRKNIATTGHPLLFTVHTISGTLACRLPGWAHLLGVYRLREYLWLDVYQCRGR